MFSSSLHPVSPFLVFGPWTRTRFSTPKTFVGVKGPSELYWLLLLLILELLLNRWIEYMNQPVVEKERDIHVCAHTWLHMCTFLDIRTAFFISLCVPSYMGIWVSSPKPDFFFNTQPFSKYFMRNLCTPKKYQEGHTGIIMYMHPQRTSNLLYEEGDLETLGRRCLRVEVCNWFK